MNQKKISNMTREEALQAIKEKMDYYESDKRLRGAIETLIPELKESEDERIIRAIIDALYSHTNSINLLSSRGYQMEDIEAWLEKQKEQNPELPKPHKGDDNNPYDMPVSEAQEYAINRGFGIPFNDGEVFIDERYITQTIGNILRWADEHPKEQKPVEYFSREKVFAIMNKLTSLSFGVPFGSNEEKQIDEITCDVRSLLDYPIEQKPDWSEEDKEALDMCLDAIPKRWKTKSGILLTKWLKDNIHLQPKQEWSEEDESCWNLIWDILDGPFAASKESYKKAAAWFLTNCPKGTKSLRPQYHGDVTMTEAYKMGLEAGKASSWKPSEEQMGALWKIMKYAVSLSSYYNIQKEIESLYNDLNKLK